MTRTLTQGWQLPAQNIHHHYNRHIHCQYHWVFLEVIRTPEGQVLIHLQSSYCLSITLPPAALQSLHIISKYSIYEIQINYTKPWLKRTRWRYSQGARILDKILLTEKQKNQTTDHRCSWPPVNCRMKSNLCFSCLLCIFIRKKYKDIIYDFMI